MIILITGASHTGKTLLAQKLLEKYKYPYLSIDLLKMGLIRSGSTQPTPLSDDADLTNYLWPIVREIIKTAIESRLDDEAYTIEHALADNARFLALARENGTDYLLIDGEYRIDLALLWPLPFAFRRQSAARITEGGGSAPAVVL